MTKQALVLLALAGCVPALGVTTPVVHPTATTENHSVGVAAGAMHASTDGGSVLVLPYSEGWVRVPAGAGQIDFHLYSSTASLGYRADLSSIRSGGVGFAIEPTVHASYFRSHEDEEDETVGAIVLGGGFTALVLIPAGSSFFY